MGVLVGGNQVAWASTCSGDYVAGYYKSAIPAVGQSLSAQIDLVTSLVHGGFVRGYVQVDIGYSQYLRIGVWDMGNGAHIFVGYDGNTVLTWTASKQNFYSVSISRDGTNTYTAHYAGNSYPVVMSGSPVESDFFADADNTSGSTCNEMDYYFRNLSPWNTNGGLTRWIYPSGPYSVRTLSSTEFEADGGS